MIIGLTGYAGVGKDTVATFLHLHGYERVSFADKLREMVIELAPHLKISEGSSTSLADVLKDTDGDLEIAKRLFQGVRGILRAVGGGQNPPSGLQRVFGVGFWIEQAFSGRDLSKNYVVTDVSFDNEARWIRSHLGVIVRVDRPGFVIPRVDVAPPDADYTIDNTGGLPELENDVRQLLGIIFR